MTRKTRLVLFFLFVFLYLVVAPVLIFYSLGYRIDLENKKIVSTGGLYLKIWPQETSVLIDNKIEGKTGLFSNEILVQGLYPRKHNILVKKDGYYPWEKTLETLEKEVTKVDNITLIKEKILFEKLRDNVESFYFSPNRDLILLFDSSENTFLIISSQTKETKSSFSLSDNDIKIISWNENLRTITLKSKNDYFLIDYNKAGVIKPEETSFENNENLVTGGNLTFEKREGYIYLLNPETEEFDSFHQAKDIIFSPDGSKFLFFNDHEILYSNSNKPSEKIFLHRFSEKISDCFWLNNNYLIFNAGGQIKISEIDTRDGINLVDIPQAISLNDSSVFELKNPKISWDEINKKLYILEQENLLVSEPLTDKNNK